MFLICLLSMRTKAKNKSLKRNLCTVAVRFAKHSNTKLWNPIPETEAVGLTLHVARESGLLWRNNMNQITADTHSEQQSQKATFHAFSYFIYQKRKTTGTEIWPQSHSFKSHFEINAIRSKISWTWKSKCENVQNMLPAKFKDIISFVNMHTQDNLAIR